MKVLLIHTGGTIGMAKTRKGLAPREGLVEAAMDSRLPQGVSLVTHVFSPLLDSSDIGPAHWNEMLGAIEAIPDAAVIITHGTDTMSFTGAALSQALAGSGRRIVLCGSMKPLNMKGDAEANMDLAIECALKPGEGVYLAFAGKVMRADGLVKHESHKADSFRNVPQDALSPAPRRRFAPQRLAVLTMSPGMPAGVLRAALSELDGCVLRVYGSGTATSDAAVLQAIKDAVKSGKRIRAVSQCETGGLTPGSYAAGSGLWAAGVENGGKETPEAALIRLWLS